ncbi:unnamed protein product [Absidia cylindrospora]
MYTDADPDYRDTPVYSGIPPPSLRDIQGSSRSRYNDQQGDLSQYNPQSRYPSSARNDAMRYNPYPTHNQGNRHADNPSHNQQQQQYPASSQLHPVAVEAPPPPPLPVSKPAPKLDMRTSTDFLECGKEDTSIKLSLADLLSHIHVAPAKVDYDFLCSNDLVRTAMALRVKGRQVPDDVRGVAKTRSNPFDCIGKHIFMNRDAMKLAALDATFHLTPTENHSGKMFTFADLCGGPGGFSEYLFWRVHQSSGGGGQARGYGMTLQSSSTPDHFHWHLENIPSNITVNFTQVDGIDGTGNLYKKTNILEFDAVVSNNTKKRGVDLVVADGCQQDESSSHDSSETGTGRLILCQIITMLTCLKQDGSFVCKFFDIFEEFSADLVWLLYQLFGAICITKPLTSDPSNSERYLICKKLRFQHPTKLIDALLSVNDAFDAQDQNVGCFVPRHILEKDEEFSDYVKMRNMKFLLKQIDALEQMETYIADPNRPMTYSEDKVQTQCLQEWNLQVGGY